MWSHKTSFQVLRRPVRKYLRSNIQMRQRPDFRCATTTLPCPSPGFFPVGIFSIMKRSIDTVKRWSYVRKVMKTMAYRTRRQNTTLGHQEGYLGKEETWPQPKRTKRHALWNFQKNPRNKTKSTDMRKAEKEYGVKPDRKKSAFGCAVTAVWPWSQIFDYLQVCRDSSMTKHWLFALTLSKQ